MVKQKSSKRKNKKTENDAAQSTCRWCQKPHFKSAHFCPYCGKTTDGAISTSMSLRNKILIIGFVIFIPVLSIFGFTQFNKPSPLLSPSKSVRVTQQQPNRLPDLSKMTPREAADQLFNRVMSANERGDKDDASRFSPMAIQAYKNVGNLDPDGLYHLGLIYLVQGDFKNTLEQARLIKLSIPTHLFAILLKHTVALRTEDKQLQTQVVTQFNTVFQKEIATRREEYNAHRNSIENLRKSLSQSINFPQTTALNDEGQTLFIKNCARCHGDQADGTDSGPPLAHKVYEPSHHSDASFHLAINNGVQSHHWQFGNMPPISGVPKKDADLIIRYVRGLQERKGIK